MPRFLCSSLCEDVFPIIWAHAYDIVETQYYSGAHVFAETYMILALAGLCLAHFLAFACGEPALRELKMGWG